MKSIFMTLLFLSSFSTFGSSGLVQEICFNNSELAKRDIVENKDRVLLYEQVIKDNDKYLTVTAFLNCKNFKVQAEELIWLNDGSEKLNKNVSVVVRFKDGFQYMDESYGNLDSFELKFEFSKLSTKKDLIVNLQVPYADFKVNNRTFKNKVIILKDRFYLFADESSYRYGRGEFELERNSAQGGYLNSQILYPSSFLLNNNNVENTTNLFKLQMDARTVYKTLSSL